MFKRGDLGKYLGIRNMRDNFKDFLFHHSPSRSDIEGVGLRDTLGRAKNPHDIFINLGSGIEILVRSKEPKAVALVKWLTKKVQKKYRKNFSKSS